MKKNRKGFTLAELLIVVAIIAVLVAIAIPVFTAQLEKSREATDLANVRSAYAEMMTEYLTWDGTSDIASIQVPVKWNNYCKIIVINASPLHRERGRWHSRKHLDRR